MKKIMNFLLLPLLCGLFFIASPAAAAAAETSIAAHDLPKDLPKVSGNIVKAVRYADSTGDNLVLLTETDVAVRLDPEYDMELRTKELFAYRFLLEQDGSEEQIWRTTDYVRDCELDGMTAAFDPNAFRLTDLDNNGVTEIWLTYYLNCAGDPGPSTMKIIMYEGGKKYAVRGTTRSRVNADEFAGGEYALGEEFASGPAEFTPFAEELWAEYRNKDL